jgi:hypothetical protein
MPELREREPDKNREKKKKKKKKHSLMQCGRKMLQGIGVDESCRILQIAQGKVTMIDLEGQFDGRRED